MNRCVTRRLNQSSETFPNKEKPKSGKGSLVNSTKQGRIKKNHLFFVKNLQEGNTYSIMTSSQ